MFNGEVVKLASGGAAVDSSATNVMRHAFGHLVQKCGQFLLGTFGHKLHSPIGKISYETGYIEPSSEIRCRVAKSDSLDPS